MLLLKDALYGSTEGGWLFPLINGNVDWPIDLAKMLGVVTAALIILTRRCVDQCPTLVIVVWLGFGCWVQSQLRDLAPFPDTHVVGSPTDGFNNAAKTYPPGKFLRDFREIAPHVHFHVRANMAGKVLFYHLIRTVSDHPSTLVWLVFGASNLGALLAYAIVRELFQDRNAGLAALVLYLFLPSKLFFLPLLNSVTPVFILLPLWLLLRYLASRSRGWLLALGMSLYALVLFEPLPLITGLVFLALIGRAWGQTAIERRHVLAIFAFVPLAFFVTDFVIAQIFGYEIVGAFRYALNDAQEFNREQKRPYGLWVKYNLIETLGNTGLLTSLVVIGIAVVGGFRMAWAIWKVGWRRARDILFEPGVTLALSVLASLIVVDLLGVNRGETVRLWIFLGTFLQLPVAGFCARRPVLLIVLVAAAILQACVGLGSRGFVMPG